MKVKFKSNKGITLVALIITIIVLLILAMVSISLVMNGGIIGKSKNAVDKYSDEEIAEQIKLAYQEYQMSQYTGTPLTLQQAMDNAFGAGVATVSGDATNGWTVTVGGKSYPLSANGTVGAPSTVVSWTKNQDGSYTAGGVTIHVGDFVNYDPTAGATEAQMTYTSYSASSAEANPTRNEGRTSGYTEDQSFDARTYKSAGYRWQVLDVKDGKVRLISEEYVGSGTYTDQNRTKYYLQGQKGYINGVAELNAISSIFGHGTGADSATSITVDDINEKTGYNPATANPKYRAGEWSEYGNVVTYTRGEGNALSSSATNGLTWSGTKDNFYYYDAITRTYVPLTSGSKEITSTAYYYKPAQVNSDFIVGAVNQDGTLNVNDTYKMLFGVATVGDDYQYRTFTKGNGQNFWLASECAYAGYDAAYWGLRNVNSGDVNYDGLYVSNGYDSSNSYSLGVRPVVSIKSSVSLKWNATAGEWQIQ